MKLISVAIFSFAIALLALAFGLEAPAFLHLLPTPQTLEEPAEPPPPPPVRPPAQTLDDYSREALDAARHQLATALQARTEAEAALDSARAHVAAANEAFEAAMLDLTEAELRQQKIGSRKSRRGRAAARMLKQAREASVANEARLREAREILQEAEAAYDESEAAMSRARASLEAVTARAHVVPVLFEAV